MKNIYICFVNLKQFEGNFEDLSDNEVLKLANENHRVYSLKGFEICFNDGESFLSGANTEFVRFIEIEEK